MIDDVLHYFDRSQALFNAFDDVGRSLRENARPGDVAIELGAIHWEEHGTVKRWGHSKFGFTLCFVRGKIAIISR